jgi:6-phosphofructokinase 1
MASQQRTFLLVVLVLLNTSPSVVAFSQVFRRRGGRTSLFTKKKQQQDGYFLHKIPKVEDWCSQDSAQVINPQQNENRIRDRYFVDESEAVLKCTIVNASNGAHVPLLPVAFMRAGPRRTLYFDPDEVVAAVVTCGGLAPGINTVIRELVLCLENQYGVRRIWGVHHGYEGFYSELER